MKDWIGEYIAAQKTALDSIPHEQVEALIRIFHRAWVADKQMFVFGNGGSAANASHFATDLGKGASDRHLRRFRVWSLNDNTPWMTALGNDYSFDDVFVRQLINHAQPGDVAMTMSVSGNSPNLVKAIAWARENGLVTIALTGAKRGRLAEVAEHVVVVGDGHYGRVEDAHMTISHILCYAFIERADDFRLGGEPPAI